MSRGTYMHSTKVRTAYILIKCKRRHYLPPCITITVKGEPVNKVKKLWFLGLHSQNQCKCNIYPDITVKANKVIRRIANHCHGLKESDIICIMHALIMITTDSPKNKQTS